MLPRRWRKSAFAIPCGAGAAGRAVLQGSSARHRRTGLAAWEISDANRKLGFQMTFMVASLKDRTDLSVWWLPARIARCSLLLRTAALAPRGGCYPLLGLCWVQP